MILFFLSATKRELLKSKGNENLMVFMISSEQSWAYKAVFESSERDWFPLKGK